MYVNTSEPSPTSSENKEQIQKFLKPLYCPLTLIRLPSYRQIRITEVQKSKKETRVEIRIYTKEIQNTQKYVHFLIVR